MPSWSPQSTYRLVVGARVPCASVFWDSWFDLLSACLVEIPPVHLQFPFRSSLGSFPVWSEEGSCLHGNKDVDGSCQIFGGLTAQVDWFGLSVGVHQRDLLHWKRSTHKQIFDKSPAEIRTNTHQMTKPSWRKQPAESDSGALTDRLFVGYVWYPVEYLTTVRPNIPNISNDNWRWPPPARAQHVQTTVEWIELERSSLQMWRVGYTDRLTVVDPRRRCRTVHPLISAIWCISATKSVFSSRFL